MLAQYQKKELLWLRERSFSESDYANVTAVQYYFYDDARLDREFYRVEHSFLSAFDKLGVLNSVLIVNKATDLIKKNAKGLQEHLEQKFPNLTYQENIFGIPWYINDKKQRKEDDLRL